MRDMKNNSETDGEITVKKFYSSWWFFRKRKYYKAIKKSKADFAFLIGKSLGAVKLYKALRENTPIFSKFDGIKILTIDPHSPLPNLIDKNHNLNASPWAFACNAKNVRQVKNWPDGAIVEGARNSTVDGVDHYTIIRHPSVKNIVRETIATIEYIGSGGNGALGNFLVCQIK